MRDYYNQRHGQRPREIDLATLNRFVAATYVAMENDGHFSEWFGFHCVDDGFVATKAGEDLAAFIDRHTYLPDMWPLRERFQEGMDEITLFTMIEFPFDHVSEPLTKDTYFHTWNQCGYHFDAWRKAPGQKRWCDELNPLLGKHGEGFELSALGEIQRVGKAGLRELMTDAVGRSTGLPDGEKIRLAVAKFRSGLSSPVQRREAVRELADVLEFHRPRIVERLLNKDDSDLFQIINKFGIRHHNEHQRSEYGADMLTWMFQVFLATSYLILELDKRAAPAPPPKPEPQPYPWEVDHADRPDDDIPF